MAKQQIHTSMLGRKIRIKKMFNDPNISTGPWLRYVPLAGKIGEIVNVYFKDGVTYDVLFVYPALEEKDIPLADAEGNIKTLLEEVHAFAFDPV